MLASNMLPVSPATSRHLQHPDRREFLETVLSTSPLLSSFMLAALALHSICVLLANRKLSEAGSNGAVETPLPPSSPPPPPSSDQASCDVHPTCSALGIPGLCCPTADGTRLDCCNSPPSPPASPPSMPPPSIPLPSMPPQPPAPCYLSLLSPTVEASLAVQSARLLTNTFETCTVPASYGLNQSGTLASLLCNRAAGSSVPSSPALTLACAEVQYSSNCNASTVVAHLLEAQRAGVAGAECCNALQWLPFGDSDDGEWRIVCQRGGAALPLLALPALLVLALLLVRLRRRQSFGSCCCSIASVLRGCCCTTCAQRPAEASHLALESTEPGASAVLASARSSEGTEYQGINQINQGALGRQLLHIASEASEERRQIDAIVLRHTKAFGLQPDSAANQVSLLWLHHLPNRRSTCSPSTHHGYTYDGHTYYGYTRTNQAEHLLSLVLSYTAQNGGDFGAAVDALHCKILGPAERWRENVDPEWKPQGGGVGEILRGLKYLERLPTRMDWTLRRARGSAVGLQRSAYAGLVTSGGRMATWVQLNTQQQLEEVALLLLLWGEAANLRFMPGMLYFIFECARAWEPAPAAAADGAPPLPWQAWAAGDAGAELREMRATVAAAREAGEAGVTLPRGMRPAPFTFLERLVRPVYRCVKGEANVHPQAPRNYDDWNEAL